MVRGRASCTPARRRIAARSLSASAPAAPAEFVQMLTHQANEKAGNTINESHVLAAVEELGFGHYTADLPASAPKGGAAGDGAEGKGRKRKLKRAQPPPGISEEEMIRQQQALFASARELMHGQSPGA